MGFFLTIEGCEGAGKTTAKGVVLEWLAKAGHDFIETREPGGTPLAEQLRSLVLAEHDERVSDTTELLMVFAARCQNLNENIEPALASGKVVVCDRFTDATYAYQGGGRGIDPSRIAILEQLVQGDRRPDMTLLLDIEPELGLARARGRAEQQGGSLDRIEQEAIDFFYRVRQVYLDRAKQFPGQYVVINGGESIAEVREQIIRALNVQLADRE
ncbi:dTMP kinase [Endozoicomonas ascidiicola]|uniref:dTMP kinase n=1 Tax=Endozoicomonas ascidiicola TaxID=1698521 RepID=UPI000829576E|nr:dTMP kinase [Endozoicomonas ascidiicola]